MQPLGCGGRLHGGRRRLRLRRCVLHRLRRKFPNGLGLWLGLQKMVRLRLRSMYMDRDGHGGAGGMMRLRPLSPGLLLLPELLT